MKKPQIEDEMMQKMIRLSEGTERTITPVKCSTKRIGVMITNVHRPCNVIRMLVVALFASPRNLFRTTK